MTAAGGSVEEALARITPKEWGELSKRLEKYIYVRLRKSSWQRAQEIAQDTFVRVLDKARPAWDRERHPDIFDCLGHYANGLAANETRRMTRRGAHVALRDDDRIHDDEAPEGIELSVDRREEEDDPPPLPIEGALLTDARTPIDLLERAPADASREALGFAALRARIEGDAAAIAVLDRMRRGKAEKPAAEAEALGVTVAEVYAAKKRLRHHARGVARDIALEAHA